MIGLYAKNFPYERMDKELEVIRNDKDLFAILMAAINRTLTNSDYREIERKYNILIDDAFEYCDFKLHLQKLIQSLVKCAK
jgi:hypothetical protein